MSIATVVTRGYGSFGSVNRVPTLGYQSSQVVVVDGPFCVVSMSVYSPHLSSRNIYSPEAAQRSAHNPSNTSQHICK